MSYTVRTPAEPHPLHGIAFHIKEDDEEYVGLDVEKLSAERDVVNGDIRGAFMEAFTEFHKKSDDLFRQMARAQIRQDPFPEEWVTVLEN